MNVLVALELLTVALQFHYYQPSTPGISAEGERAILIIFAVFWLGLIYLLWRGANWARIVVIIGSALGVLGVFSIASQAPINQTLTIFNTLLALGWIIFLSSRPAKEFTRSIAVSNSTP
jgi:peptidoglycan/LPS O-acetylase OafA/YrhL